jgi:hypothetical protein
MISDENFGRLVYLIKNVIYHNFGHQDAWVYNKLLGCSF